MTIKKILNIVIFLLICSCSHSKDEVWRRISVDFKNQGFTQRIYQKEGFNIFTLEKISNKEKPLRIYIEGDGFAYATKSRPSVDPTPRSNFLLDLILLDDSENLLYIARPCQYIDSDKCEEKYWTQERFSSEIIQAISMVVDYYKDYQIELVGYSGGAFVAMQLKQKNIKNLRTMAGNLDLEAFVNFHKISVINAINLDYQRLANLPQIHFIGAEDEIIPLEIIFSYQKRLRNKNCINFKIIDEASHYKGWNVSWKDLLNLEVKCL